MERAETFPEIPAFFNATVSSTTPTRFAVSLTVKLFQGTAFSFTAFILPTGAGVFASTR